MDTQGIRQIGRAVLVLAILAGLLVMVMGADMKIPGSTLVTQGTTQSYYDTVATLTSAAGDPETTGRSLGTLTAAADTAVAIWTVPKGANAASFRFRITAEDDTATVRALTFRASAANGAYDDGSLAYQWAVTGGAMTAVGGGVYVDTCTPAAYALAGGNANSVQTDWIYEYEIDLAGIAYMAFYLTAEVTDEVYVDAVVY